MRFHIHKWGQWEVGNVEVVRLGETMERAVQGRQCLKCHKIKWEYL